MRPTVLLLLALCLAFAAVADDPVDASCNPFDFGSPLEFMRMPTDAVGWVAGLVCAFPQETVKIYHLIQEGKNEEAREIYRWFLPLLELDIHPKLVQYIKLAEHHCGIGSEHVRAPRLTLIGEERARIEKIITDGLKKRPVL